MIPKEFVAKWSRIQQKETAVSQSHFNDVCQLVGHPVPLEFDPEGRRFSFETQTDKPDGSKGFADVYFQGHFIWEYKGPHKNLDKAYQQLQLYRESLQNPPLLITSDIHNIIIHTNFNNYPTQTHKIGFDEIISGNGVEKLRWAFFDPDKFKPAKTREYITKATADTFLAVAEQMKQHRNLLKKESYSNEQLAHFLVQILFALFAEDIGLLPDNLFTQMARARGGDYAELHHILRGLFAKMQSGGFFGVWTIRHFNGTLFDNDFVPDIPSDLGDALLPATEQDWSQVDPSIFGTLFERIIDESKRAQLGAHYTSEADIMLIVEPVLMQPLRQKWDAVRRQAQTLRVSETIRVLLADFAAEIAAVRVLDPACGSGNFLYVALRELLSLQKEVIAYAARKGLPPIELTVSPEQLFGIEINPYAHELAQITAWIGYLQWRQENGFGEMDDPILRPLHNIQRMDALLATDADGNLVEPEWPAADVIIGNPPFLGGQKILRELGEAYTRNVRKLYNGRVPHAADLVTYWFEKARAQISSGKTNRAGLLATQSIRGEASRPVLNEIKNSGDIFMAWSDRPWILDGAAVRVSMIGFDNGHQQTKILNGRIVNQINADLTFGANLTTALSLSENNALGYMGIIRVGPFEISEENARKMLNAVNKAAGKKNENVVKHWIRAKDLTDRPQNAWIVDFGTDMTLEEAQKYEMPIAHVRHNVKPKRDKTSNGKNRKEWWLFEGRRTGMRKALLPLDRYIATPLVGKHRLFRWYNTKTIPDARVIVIAREEDFYLGVLHSKIHELWALERAARHGDGKEGGRPTYNVTTCLASFPFPWVPGQEPSEAEDARVAAIGHWARALVAWRQAWLNPPREGMYAGLGDAYDKMVKKRTLTNLYNGLVYYRQTVGNRPQGSSRSLGSAGGASQLWDQAQFDKVTRKSVSRSSIQELDDIHAALDTAVLDAYGWSHTLSDAQILEHLLALNLQRAAAQKK